MWLWLGCVVVGVGGMIPVYSYLVLYDVLPMGVVRCGAAQCSVV